MKLNMIIVDGHSVGPALYNRVVEYFNPTLCPTGQALRSLLDRLVTDVFLINVNLPGMNGYDVCRMIRDNPNYAKTPIIFLTHGVSLEEKLHGYRSGGNNFIDIHEDASVFMHKLHTIISEQAHLADSDPAKQSRFIFQTEERNSWNTLASHLSPIFDSTDTEELAGKLIVGCEGFNLSNSLMFFLPTGSRYYSPAGGGDSRNEYEMLLEAKQGGDIITIGNQMIFNSSYCNLLVRDRSQTLLQTQQLAAMMRILLRIASEKIGGFVKPVKCPVEIA